MTDDLRTRIAAAIYAGVMESCDGYLEGQEGGYTVDPTDPDDALVVDGRITFTWILLPALELTDIGHHRWSGRGDTYYFKIAGHDIQVYVTEKCKKVRVFVDHAEWESK